MRSLLRASRRRHIGALKSYIPYAVGEIFSVVVGILIALEVNNYNDVECLPCDGKYSKIAPLRILSFDIECAA